MRELAYTADGPIYVPERRFDSLEPDHTTIPLRGYAHVLAVIDAAGECVGWILLNSVSIPEKVPS